MSELERSRKLVMQNAGQNDMTEQYINQLDNKIALLIRNKTSVDDVLQQQKLFGGHIGSLLANKEVMSKDPFKALNAESRRKLEGYQQLFFLLQTQPHYLARLFRRIRERATAEKECQRISILVMAAFGHAQKRREEYWLLKLLSKSIKEEVDNCRSLQDYLRGNFFWSKVFAAYTHRPDDRKWLKDVLGPLIKAEILEKPDLDLEIDPQQIYKASVADEELRTGRKSMRAPELPREEAVRDPQTRNEFVERMQALRDIVDLFLAALENLSYRMPYGVRFIAGEILSHLRAHFPYEDESAILHVVGFWLWKSYLQPALVSPERWSVVDRGLSQRQKRNLAEISTVINQVAVARQFSERDNVFMIPLNNYIMECVEHLDEIWNLIFTVPDVDSHFDIDIFNDLYAKQKPDLWIKTSDIFAIHNLIATELAAISSGPDDVLREVLTDCGNVKSNEKDFLGESRAQHETHLILSPKLHEVEDPEADVNRLFMETKRCVLYIIRVQTGANLMDILVRPVTSEDEDKWDAVVSAELAQRRNPHSRASRRVNTLSSDTWTSSPPPNAPASLDITSTSYAELKSICLSSIIALERCGKITRHNQYQDILNALASDIRTKHRRRIQRSRELATVRATIHGFEEHQQYLTEKLDTYNDYIEQAMSTLQKQKKGKRGFVMPLSRQWVHQRELRHAGREPRFGSFKYSLARLSEKGILVYWKGYWEAQVGTPGGSQGSKEASLTISSEQVGVFHIEGSNGPLIVPGAVADVTLDELLECQFNNEQYIDLFDGDDYESSMGHSQSAGMYRGGPGSSSPMEGRRSWQGSVRGRRSSFQAGMENSKTGITSTQSLGSGSGTLRLNVNLLQSLIYKKFFSKE